MTEIEMGHRAEEPKKNAYNYNKMYSTVSQVCNFEHFFCKKEILFATKAIVKIYSLFDIFLKLTAVLVGNLIMLQFGMSIAMPTVIIGALKDNTKELSLTDMESSWYGEYI